MIIKDTGDINEIKIIENNREGISFSNKKDVLDNLLINEIYKESLETATFKLKKITNPDYSTFSVRFVNIEEYKDIVESRPLKEEKEVFVFGKNGQDKLSKQFYMNHIASLNEDFYSFADYLRFGGEKGNDWEYVARIQTNWEAGNYNLLTAQLLFNYFKEIKINLKNKKLTAKEYDKYFSNELRDKIINANRDNIKRIINNTKEGSIINDFINNPEILFQDKDNLRKLFNAIVFAEYEKLTKQYHIAMIFDSDAVIPIRDDDNYHHWSNISPDIKPRHLLASIAVMPNKELWSEMIKLSLNAKKLAHPIFSRTGELKRPKEKK